MGIGFGLGEDVLGEAVHAFSWGRSLPRVCSRCRAACTSEGYRITGRASAVPRGLLSATNDRAPAFPCARRGLALLANSGTKRQARRRTADTYQRKVTPRAGPIRRTFLSALSSLVLI